MRSEIDANPLSSDYVPHIIVSVIILLLQRHVKRVKNEAGGDEEQGPSVPSEYMPTAFLPTSGFHVSSPPPYHQSPPLPMQHDKATTAAAAASSCYDNATTGASTMTLPASHLVTTGPTKVRIIRSWEVRFYLTLSAFTVLPFYSPLFSKQTDPFPCEGN